MPGAPLRGERPKGDPGLQPERTGLSWSRTGLLAMLVALLLARVGMDGESLLHLCAALLLGTMAGALLHRAHLRARFEAGDDVVAASDRRLVKATSAVIVAAATLLVLATAGELLGF
ncbi:DUF202 domain-containing protein [Ancylobacter sp. MQZ15Z-1]|uniref:DUF202 domain-containing protein n=1 Tax=Ancylobacter mangrovi TaxID=2972472 RepID=A0A9X2T7V5_9HYPH|nr:DUF202 domain-containing protein [Ancylobacter mangrovi]MCS0496493.1 DUF202 domain-containing protein [Ancylobacter mangrovi]